MPRLHDGGAMAGQAGPHPTRAELEDFMLGKSSQRESRRVILHLLPGCSGCRQVTADLWEAATGSADPAGIAGDPAALAKRFRYDTQMNRVINRVRSAQADLEAERAEARHRMAELDAQPRDRWPGLVQADPRFHTWGFCELLLGRARKARDLGEAGVCAGLTVSLAGRIDTSIHPDALVQELTARAWTALADVWREAGDLKSAEESLRRAEAHLLRGTGDRLERGRLLERKAALRTAQERPEDAARLLSRSILLYRRLGQWDQVGRVLVELGCVERMGRMGRAGERAQAVRRGILGLWLDRLRRIGARVPLLRD